MADEEELYCMVCDKQITREEVGYETYLPDWHICKKCWKEQGKLRPLVMLVDEVLDHLRIINDQGVEVHGGVTAYDPR